MPAAKQRRSPRPFPVTGASSALGMLAGWAPPTTMALPCWHQWPVPPYWATRKTAQAEPTDLAQGSPWGHPSEQRALTEAVAPHFALAAMAALALAALALAALPALARQMALMALMALAAQIAQVALAVQAVPPEPVSPAVLLERQPGRRPMSQPVEPRHSSGPSGRGGSCRSSPRMRQPSCCPTSCLPPPMGRRAERPQQPVARA
mmetsp:Transcript_15006/g.33035  ORF Transcript_15006/g.33035 Transcript_15006/m.33035 type:complete len:206 (-) Transcript_15006:561-1178(-)